MAARDVCLMAVLTPNVSRDEDERAVEDVNKAIKYLFSGGKIKILYFSK